MNTFSEVIRAWPSVVKLAEELNEKPETVRKWRTRNSIPASKWQALVKSARRHRIPIGIIALSKIAADDK
jgi:hypothetical protein